ncbi:hypothetical protein DSM21852_19560 [Methylocystis bryophila]|nr:hypothetical protein DSM21852_19560 [Methylocystis bryophila]
MQIIRRGGSGSPHTPPFRASDGNDCTFAERMFKSNHRPLGEAACLQAGACLVDATQVGGGACPEPSAQDSRPTDPHSRKETSAPWRQFPSFSIRRVSWR